MPVRVRLVVMAGPVVGRGHLGRALSLAETMAERGTVTELQLLAGSLEPNEARRAADARLSLVAAGSVAAPGTAVVVDLPDPDVAPPVEPARLLVIDDRDTFAGEAAVIVQPSKSHWDGPGTAEIILAGFEHVPIAAAVRRRRAEALATEVAEVGRRLVACFGGSDPSDVTARLVGALAGLDADLEVIVGPTYRGSVADWPVDAIRDPLDLVDRLAAADVVVLGAGTMKFDAACLGRPGILVAVADDQLPVGPAFASTGAARYLGDGRTIEPATVGNAAAALLADRAARAGLGRRAAEVIDGDGADRIAAVLEGLAHQS
jgi:UDP-2,4-diacetamido-2,4,6-trideoxy-beta-L-altropyranose hydrolase